jgi:MerR family copper efflux transcriptional regulator
MTIGEAARASGISAKMIRHYEAIGLLSRSRRSLSGYRVYDRNDVHTLQFIRQARDTGFSISEIKKLLSLWEDRDRPAGEVRRLAVEHLKTLEAKIAELQAIATTLNRLVELCQGSDRPECPILDALAGDTACQSHIHLQIAASSAAADPAQTEESP